MVEAADLRDRHDVAITGPHDRTGNRRVFIQRQVSPGLFMVRAVVPHQLSHARFVERDHVIVFNEAGLKRLMTLYCSYYHEERPHQGLGNELIAPKTTSIGSGPVMCRARLGGVLKFYDREAA
jgi:hypothetical protein